MHILALRIPPQTQEQEKQDLIGRPKVHGFFRKVVLPSKGCLSNFPAFIGVHQCHQIRFRALREFFSSFVRFLFHAQRANKRRFVPSASRSSPTNSQFYGIYGSTHYSKIIKRCTGYTHVHTTTGIRYTIQIQMTFSDSCFPMPMQITSRVANSLKGFTNHRCQETQGCTNSQHHLEASERGSQKQHLPKHRVHLAPTVHISTTQPFSNSKTSHLQLMSCHLVLQYDTLKKITPP